MGTMAFISRHEPTSDQHRLANEAGWNLVHVGDVDAFSDLGEFMHQLWDDGYRGVACVHPLIALSCFQFGYRVGVFRNENRAEIGQPPRFLATALIIETGIDAPDSIEP